MCALQTVPAVDVLSAGNVHVDVDDVRFNIGLQLRTGSVNQKYNAAHLEPTNNRSTFRYSDAVTKVRVAAVAGACAHTRAHCPSHTSCCVSRQVLTKYKRVFPAVLRAVEGVLRAPRTGNRSRYKFAVAPDVLPHVLRFLATHAVRALAHHCFPTATVGDACVVVAVCHSFTGPAAGQRHDSAAQHARAARCGD